MVVSGPVQKLTDSPQYKAFVNFIQALGKAVQVWSHGIRVNHFLILGLKKPLGVLHSH